MDFKTTVKYVLSWRILILICATLAMYILPIVPRYTNQTSYPSTGNLLTMWSNFDGNQNLSIAQFGYDYATRSNQSYSLFPVYPWLIGNLNVFNSYLISSLFLSHLFLIASIFVLYRLVLLDEKPKIAKSTILLLLLFPTSFFFGSVYSESLFLFLALSSLFFARKKLFFLSSIMALIASATKITGIFLWISIIYEYWLANEKNIKKLFRPNLIWLFLPPLGLISYLQYIFERIGKPEFISGIFSILFGENPEKLILIHQVIFRYFKMLFLTDIGSSVFFTVLLEFISAILIITVIIFAYKNIRFSYWIYLLLAFIFSGLSGTFVGFPRLILVIFPVFIFLGKWLVEQGRGVRLAFYGLLIILSIFSIAFFSRGYFIG